MDPIIQNLMRWHTDGLAVLGAGIAAADVAIVAAVAVSWWLARRAERRIVALRRWLG